MKKVACLFILILALAFNLKSQIAVTDVTIYREDYKTFDVGEIADDTCYWFRIRGNSAIDLTFDFSDFSGDAAVTDIYKGHVKNDSIYYVSINGTTSVTLPLTLVRATYLQTHESDTTYAWGIEADDWKADLIGVFIDPNSTTGTLKVIIDR